MSDTEKTNTGGNASFGLPATDTETIADLRRQLAEAEAKIRAAGGPESDPAEGTGPLDSQGFPKEYVRIEIDAGRDKQDLSYVPLAIGGYAIKVNRGVEVILPTVFEAVLKNAVEEITVQSEGGLITRPSRRFPYQVRGTATEAEFLAFREANKAAGAKAAVR